LAGDIHWLAGSKLQFKNQLPLGVFSYLGVHGVLAVNPHLNLIL
jgi:hypothetical protein